MCIEDVGVTAVVINSQRFLIILEDVASLCITCTTNKVSHITSLEISISLAPFFVGPGCTVLQPQVSSTGKGYIIFSNAIAAILVVHNASQAGGVSSQAKVKFTLGSVNICTICCTGMQANVTLDSNLIAICAGNITFLIFENIHVDNAVHSIDSSIRKSLILVNSNVAALNINYSTATVGHQAIGITLEVNITVNGNSAALG